MRTITILMLLAMEGLTGCTSSTFLASKDGKGYYVGSGSDAAYRMFCTSGDMKKILADTQLPEKQSEALLDATCGDRRSSARVKELYADMTPEQRKDLRKAFKRNGYDINYLPC